MKTEHFSGDHCLALPKLNIQFLTMHDYLLRNFNLFRLESNYEIRSDLEEVVLRMSPEFTVDANTNFRGWSRMAVPIMDFNIVEIGRPSLGERKPSKVKADVTFNLQKYTDTIKQEWESLRPVCIRTSITLHSFDADPFSFLFASMMFCSWLPSVPTWPRTGHSRKTMKASGSTLGWLT